MESISKEPESKPCWGGGEFSICGTDGDRRTDIPKPKGTIGNQKEIGGIQRRYQRASNRKYRKGDINGCD